MSKPLPVSRYDKGCTKGEIMDEVMAYKWAGQITAGCTAEPHKTQQCADLIVSALMEATKELTEKLDEYENAYKFIADDKCFNEEKHCACAPILRAKVRKLEAENAELRKRLEPIEAYWDDLQNRFTAGVFPNEAIKKCMALKEK